MKVLILVLSHNDGDGVYSKFYETQKNTWDSIVVENVETYYFFGNHHTNEIVGNDILLNVTENYVWNCGKKTIEAFKLIKDFDFDFIFRTNSSSYVDKKMLTDFLSNKPTEKYYSGVIGIHGGIKFASGSGYFLSKDLVTLTLDNIEKWNHNFIDDVALGLLLSEFGVYPDNNVRFDVINENIPNDFFHYRLRSENRTKDIENMFKIFEGKKNLYEDYNWK